jgi:N-methylhydantoinase A/oxoprolinase/acetone carboxylase beta subunit
MASLSTTLATNALVEGHGAALHWFILGFPKKTLPVTF